MRSPYRTHDRSTFFKYMSLNTAKIVLDTSSLRWSSPVIFNDPFDVPREVLAGVNEVSIGKALAKKLREELLHPRQDLENLNSSIRILLVIYRQLFPQGVPAELVEKLQEIELDPPVGFGAPGAIQEMKDTWKTLLNNRRILCLSESATIPPMWNHYGEAYKGIVIEFECIDDLDSAWLIAQPVNYTNTMPLTYTAEGIAELLFLPEHKATEYINQEITFIKTLDWAYEKEWRVSTYARQINQQNFSDFTFNPYEVKSVILGPLFEENELVNIITLTKKYPRAKIYKSSFGALREIVFEPLD